MWPALCDSNLVSFRLPSQFSAPFLALQINCTGRQWSQQVIKEKEKKRGKKRILHPFLKPWRALRQNIIFFSLMMSHLFLKWDKVYGPYSRKWNNFSPGISLTSQQPCTQRNIFGSHWLLNVQTSVARAKNELFWKQVSYFTDSACQYWSTVHKFLHHSHASPSSPSLLRLPPPKKIKDCCRFDTFLVSLSTPQLLSKLYLVFFEY